MHAMRRLSCLLALLLALGARPAAATAYDYAFTIANFSQGASLTIAFNGTDADSDGLIFGYYLPNASSLPPFANEITALSLSFTGNSIIPAFNAATSDFTAVTGALLFLTGGNDGFQLIYTLDATGAGVTNFSLPPGTANGDALIFAAGGLSDIPLSVQAATCGGFGGDLVIAPGICGQINYGPSVSTLTDYAGVPEPASMALLGAGLGLLALRRRRA